MKLKFLIITVSFFTVLSLFILNQVFSNLIFSEVLPNTVDDTNLEYIELYNNSDSVMFLSWYILKDKSDKQFIFDWSYFLTAHEKKKYFRTETNILLNNTDEQLFLYDAFWNLLDSKSYLTSEKWVVIIIYSDIIPAILAPAEVLEIQTGSLENTQSGSNLISQSGSELLTQSWTLSDTQSWNILTIQTGSILLTQSSSLLYTQSWTTNIINQVKNSLPQIEYSFQSPSYLLEKDDIVSVYNCDTTKEECKINLDFRNSFVWDIKELDFNCETNFWFITWEENKCNPWTIIVPLWTYDFLIKIKNKIEPTKISEISFKIINKWYIKPVLVVPNIYISNTYTDNIPTNTNINIIKPEIIIQSGLNNNNECTNNKNCSINFNYQTKNSKEKCIWDFWTWIFEIWTEQKCNPWYVKYSNWDFLVKLKVNQDWNTSNFNTNEIKFSNNIIEKDIKVDDTKIIIKKETEKNKDKKSIEKELITNLSIVRNNIKLKINKILVNPTWSDNLEYIEIINKWEDIIDLYGCTLDDIKDWWSKVYKFWTDEKISKWEIKRYYKEITKLNLNNDNDEVNLYCYDSFIDKLSWDFKVKEWYYLDHSRLDIFSGKAKVIEVIDWDTIKIQFLSSKKIEKMRLIWIDTPETKNPKIDVQKFWQEAYDYVNDNISWEEIDVEMDPNNFRDSYSRLLWFVYIDWESFNKKLIQLWYAKAYLDYDFKYSDEYKKAETVAKKEHLGIWASSDEEIVTQKAIKSDWKIISWNIKAIISIQWTIWKNKTVIWNTITCFDTCTINFDWSISTWNIKKYSWDFWNWLKYEWKNPKSFKYDKFWVYKVYLAVLWDSWELNIWEYIVNFYQTPKKLKKISLVNKVNADSKDEKKYDKEIEQAKIDLSEDNNSIIYYIFIAVFWVVLVITLLWREKMI